MGKFNTTAIGLGNGLLNQMSQNLKEGYEIQYIPIDLIDENENNNYSVEDIDELAASIKEVGLKQNLDVMKSVNGRYKILTGHRRFRALCQLAETDSKYRNIPCTITELSSVHIPLNDDSKEKYLIHVTNSTQRNMTEADIYNQYNDLVSIYKEAVDNGYKLTDKRRNLIASDMNLSAAQIGKMDYIRNNASQELLDALNNNNVTISTANEIAHLKPSEQKKAISKPAKPKFIDTLTDDSYLLNNIDLSNLHDKAEQINAIYKLKKDEVELSKKEYAKLHDHYNKVIVALDNIEKILDLI